MQPSQRPGCARPSHASIAAPPRHTAVGCLAPTAHGVAARARGGVTVAAVPCPPCKAPSPLGPTKGSVPQLLCCPPCHAGNRGSRVRSGSRNATGPRYASSAAVVPTCSGRPAASAGVTGRHRRGAPAPRVGSGVGPRARKRLGGHPPGVDTHAHRPLPWCPGVPCAPTGGNGPAARRVGHTGGHRVWGAAATPGRPAPMPPPRRRRGAAGGAVGGPGRAGAQRQGGRRHLSARRPPPSRPGLRPVAAPAGQAPTPAGGTRQPPPGVPRGGARALGAGPRRGVGRPATPPRGAWARAPLPLVPAGPPDGAPVARPPRPPGTARRRGPGAAPRGRTHHRSGRQPGSRGAVTPAPPPCARGPPRPRLATAGSVLPQRPVRPRRPVTAPVAVRTVQGCPIQG